MIIELAKSIKTVFFGIRGVLFTLLCLAGISIGLARVNAQSADSPWPMFHGNDKHTGLSPYDTSHVDGTLLWSFETGDGIESSPAIASDGTIYIASHDCILYALNPDGTEKWQFKAGDPIYNQRWDVWKGIMSSPAIASDGTIYITSSSNYLFAIHPDGTEKWRFYVKWDNDFWSSPTIGPDGTVFVGSARDDAAVEFPSGLYAINPDGTEKWHFEIASGVTSSPAVGDDGTVYVGGAKADPWKQNPDKGKVFAIDSNGEKKWEFTTELWMESSPAIGSDGTIYIGSGREGNIFAIHPDGSEKWRFNTGDGVSAVPAIGKDGTLYIGSWNSIMYAINPDGTEKWRSQTGEAFEGISSSAAISAEGTIYVGSNDHNLYAFNPDGTERWHFTTPGSGVMSSPAIGKDGTIYFGSWDHNLYAIGGAFVDEATEEVVDEGKPSAQIVGTSTPGAGLGEIERERIPTVKEIEAPSTDPEPKDVGDGTTPQSEGIEIGVYIGAAVLMIVLLAIAVLRKEGFKGLGL